VSPEKPAALRCLCHRYFQVFYHGSPGAVKLFSGMRSWRLVTDFADLFLPLRFTMPSGSAMPLLHLLFIFLCDLPIKMYGRVEGRLSRPRKARGGLPGRLGFPKPMTSQENRAGAERKKHGAGEGMT